MSQRQGRPRLGCQRATPAGFPRFKAGAHGRPPRLPILWAWLALSERGANAAYVPARRESHPASAAGSADRLPPSAVSALARLLVTARLYVSRRSQARRKIGRFSADQSCKRDRLSIDGGKEPRLARFDVGEGVHGPACPTRRRPFDHVRTEALGR